jgi:hypothetical protein
MMGEIFDLDFALRIFPTKVLARRYQKEKGTDLFNR